MGPRGGTVENLEIEFWKNKKVLVTGASGFVGSNLVQKLLNLGSQVTTFINEIDKFSPLVQSKNIYQTQVIFGDLSNFDSVHRSIKDPEIEIIFHLGAETIVQRAYLNPLRTMQSNVEGTWNILESVRLLESQVQSTVIASSDKAYGNSTMLPYHENFPLSGVGLYDVSKSCTDLISKSYALNFKLNVSIARCGNIYGPGDLNWSRIVPGTIRSILKNEKPIIRSSGKNLRDYIYIEDILDAYLKLGKFSRELNFGGEAFNFSREEPISVIEIVDEIRKSLEDKTLEPVILNEAGNEIIDQHLDSSKARNILKWQPKIDLATGLQSTKEWYIKYLHENKMI